MKKIIALALSLILVLSLSVTAFAAKEITSADGTNDGEATGTYIAGDGALDTYCVDVTWTGLAFQYTANQKVWNPDTHTEDEATTEGTWSTGAKVTVVNHSNVAVVATASATKNDVAGNDATIAFGANNGTELRAANSVEGAAELVIDVTAGGKLASTWVAGTKIYDLTLTLSAPQNG